MARNTVRRLVLADVVSVVAGVELHALPSTERELQAVFGLRLGAALLAGILYVLSLVPRSG